MANKCRRCFFGLSYKSQPMLTLRKNKRSFSRDFPGSPHARRVRVSARRVRACVRVGDAHLSGFLGACWSGRVQENVCCLVFFRTAVAFRIGGLIDRHIHALQRRNNIIFGNEWNVPFRYPGLADGGSIHHRHQPPTAAPTTSGSLVERSLSRRLDKKKKSSRHETLTFLPLTRRTTPSTAG